MESLVPIVMTAAKEISGELGFLRNMRANRD
jgi:hypothetical protein